MVLIVVKSTKNVKVDLKKLKNELQLWARTNLIIGVNKFKMATKLVKSLKEQLNFKEQLGGTLT